MFGFVFRKAQATVDSAVGQLVNGLIMAVPFLVAFGFATAALAEWLHGLLDPMVANLVLACVFLVLGSLLAIALRSRPNAIEEDVAAAGTDAAGTDEEKLRAHAFTEADRELFMATASSLGPVLLPLLMRNLSKILPIVLALVAAGFVIYRTLDEPDSEAGVQPAE